MQLDLTSGVSMQSLICDADYLGLLDCVKGSLLPPPLDANEMEKVRGQVLGGQCM